jgi:hypothetical protein
LNIKIYNHNKINVFSETYVEENIEKNYNNCISLSLFSETYVEENIEKNYNNCVSLSLFSETYVEENTTIFIKYNEFIEMKWR